MSEPKKKVPASRKKKSDELKATVAEVIAAKSVVVHARRKQWRLDKEKK